LKLLRTELNKLRSTILRTPEEREQAIRKATKEVQNLETSTDEMNHEVLALKDSVTQTEVNING